MSVEKVGDEPMAGAHELADWAKERGAPFFQHSDANVGAAFAQVSAGGGSGKYEASTASIFLQLGDYYLVAQALAGSHVVVTHEIPSAAVRGIKIPDACLALG